MLTLSRECRVGGSLALSCPSLLEEEVEGRGPGDPRRAGGDIARGGGEDDRMEEIRGDSGPCGDMGGDCAPKGLRPRDP